MAPRARAMPHPTIPAAMTVRTVPPIVTALRNSPVCSADQCDAAMFPVKRAARMVPETAMPIAVVSSLAVSTSAAPMVVRSLGRARMTLVPATTPTTRMPIATSTRATATDR